ncbi:hypothetical protein [Flavobacterium hungaricum]|uniref:Uncharacterized protein n=1 Tax=Flavobacterium hungaricum TaxID=2082725 RepID=A0ABR9TRN4_9FLAO|nr:hypothetical protein [Flavobacterium hungaricum]MBE8727988.1 hypothetical protein [Flavobacterium hungaricum]
MIKSTEKGMYGDGRTGFKYSKIFTKVVSFKSYPYGRVYQLENYLIDDNDAMTLYGTQFEKTLSNADVKALDMYVESLGLSFTKEENGHIVELTHNEREWAKIPHGLLHFVKNDFLTDEDGNSTDKTVFWLKPEKWVLS